MKKMPACLSAAAALFLNCAALFAQNENYLLIGTYTSGKSEGIYVYKFNSETGDFSYISTARGVQNPSYLAVSPDNRFVYAVNENGKGGVTAFAFNNKEGALYKLNQESSGGDNPCYITTDEQNHFVVVGNYTSGTLSVLPVNKNGSVQPPVQIIRHEGKGPNEARQEQAHVHCTYFSPDHKYLFVPDLGMDKVMIYSFNKQTGKLTPAPAPFALMNPGSGPRHITFHPNGKFAYLIEELSGTISAFTYAKGKLQLFETVNALPKDYKGPVGSADIHVSPDGKFLYGSNRGESNTIAIYRINENNGRLSFVGHQSTMGKTPRNFNFDPPGNYLLAANQNSDEIIIFKRDTDTGKLTPTGKKIEVGSPVCLKWIPVR